MSVQEGDVAPDFEMPASGGRTVSLSALKGKPFILYFYPKADTPGCTKEACQFNENLKAFDRSGVTVLGISPDGAEKHQRFITKYKLKFPLLTDETRSVMEKYGAYGEKVLYGKKTVGVIRSTFIVDEKGKIAKAWYSVKADGHAAKVLEALD